LLGEEGFISLASWPEPDEKLMDTRVEESENFSKDVMEDTQNIIRATKTTPSKICYYTSALWKWELYLTMLEKAQEEKWETSRLIKELLNHPELREHAKEVVKTVPKIAEEIMKIPEEKRKTQLNIGVLDEYETLEKAKTFLGEEFNAEIYVFREDDQKRYDPKQRATLAKPYRPAIFIE
jgi:leucyl-tRNA synthetase